MPSKTPSQTGRDELEDEHFEIIPAVHLYKGAAVTPSFDVLDEAPITLVRQLTKKRRTAYVVDFEGFEYNKPDIELIRKLGRRSIWVDACSKTAEDMVDLFIAGAQRVTLRVHAVADKKELDACCELSDEHLYLGLEWKNRSFRFGCFRDMMDVSTYIMHHGLGGLVVIDRDRAGTGAGIDKTVLKLLPADEYAVYYAGGVRHRADAALLKEQGLAGAIVGTASLSTSFVLP